MLPILGFVHAAIVIGLTLAGLRASRLDWITRTVVAAVIVWVNLVLTALVLSPFGALGQPIAYLCVSSAIALAGAWIFDRAGAFPDCTEPARAEILGHRSYAGKALLAFLIATAVLALLASILLAVSYLPNNPDTVSYRLPRIFWYRDWGSLTHFAEHIDPRGIFYPFDGALLMLPMAQYRLPGRLFTFVFVAAWCVIFAVLYRFTRSLGLGPLSAVGTAWVTCLAPGVLVQATSTNDEILAASAMLVAVHHAWRFSRKLAPADLSLALMAASLSIGTKLHVFFFWPFVLGGMVWGVILLVRHRAEMSVFATSLRPRSLAGATGILGISAALALAFIVPNLMASGHMMEPEFSTTVLNRPFDMRAGLQNLVLHSVQSAFGAIPDLTMLDDANARRELYIRFNGFFSNLFTWVDQGPNYMSVSYRFNGITQASAWFFGETSLETGFAYLMVAGAAWMAFCRRIMLGTLLSLALFVWFVTYCLSMKYVEGFSTYLIYAFIVCSPLIATFWVRGGVTAGPTKVAILLLVVATHSVLALNVLRFNIIRNVPAALRAKAWPVLPPGTSAEVADVLRRHGGARFIYTHWEVPYWDMMSVYKGGHYSIGPAKSWNQPGALAILSFQKIPAYGAFVPICLAAPGFPGLTFVGNLQSAWGPEWVFAAGADNDPGRPSGCLVLEVVEDTRFGQATAKQLEVKSLAYGLPLEHPLEFQYSARFADGSSLISPWDQEPARILQKLALPGPTRLTIEIRRADRPGEITRIGYPFGAAEPFAAPGIDSRR